MNSPISIPVSLSIPDTIVARQVGDEMVLLDLDSGTYFTLNGTGAFIWNQVVAGAPRKAIADGIVEHWEVELAEADIDINEFLTEMVGLGLLTGE